jgi:hypothetical protein
MVRKVRVKLALQLRAQGLSGRAISTSQSMSRHSVQAVIAPPSTVFSVTTSPASREGAERLSTQYSALRCLRSLEYRRVDHRYLPDLRRR